MYKFQNEKLNVLGNKSITYFNGKNLENKLYEYSNYKRRFYVDTVFNFLENSSKRCVELFGLRRVGKTVSIFHIIDKLIKSNVSSNEILYIECNESLSVDSLVLFIENMNSKNKLKYEFIDEVTEIDDFISSANNLIEMKIPVKTILTGSSSLVFYYSKQYLLGRCLKINPTYISYKEWYYLKGGSIFDYIKNAGILDNLISTEEYIQDAVSYNIQSSLKKYSDIERSIGDLDLRVLDLINCYDTIIVKSTELFTNRFELESIKSKFESFNVNYSNSKYLEKSIFTKTEIYKYIAEKLNDDYNVDSLTQNDVRLLLSLLVKGDFYYKLINRNIIDGYTIDEERYCSTQPSIRYKQFVKQKDILQNSLGVGNDINVENIVEGNILEDTIRLNIDRALPSEYFKSFHLRIDNLIEIDSVIKNMETNKVILVEIKRKKNYSKADFRWLVSEDITNYVHGNIVKRLYLYNGKTIKVDYNDTVIDCINIEEFLLSIDTYIDYLY